MAEDESAAEAGWRARPLILAGLGLAAGLIANLIYGDNHTTPSSLQLTALTGIVLAAGLTGFTLERHRWWASIAFSVGAAVVGALVVWWNGPPSGWAQTEGWRMLSLLLAVAIAAPLFQAARDEGARRFPYEAVHDHAWTNVVLWFACWAFVAIVFALSWLLAMLFDLIKLEFLKELLQKDWFWRALLGAAFGGALGLLREQDGVVRLLYRVVATILAVLAPVLAVGLVLFVLALPFTGLDALWDATKATTPILLVCAVGALILANAVIGNRPEQERRSPPIRYAAMALAAVILPLAVLAAIAIRLRIGQYGFTPERLWAVVFVSFACLYGAAYLAALALGRQGWAARVRPYNLALAFTTCGVALLLATPLISFNAISTRDQLARLESGRTPPDKFDWRALAFDFGQPGRKALDRLKRSVNGAIRDRAIEAANAKFRYELSERPQPAFAGRYDVRPAGAGVPDTLRTVLEKDRACQDHNLCRVQWVDAQTAIILDDGCAQLPPDKQSDPAQKCEIDVHTYLLAENGWRDADVLSPTVQPVMTAVEERKSLKREYDAITSGQVTVRKVEMRQTFIGDEPQGKPFR